MFKTARRYLSGVSVFYGDDITRRDVTGEIAFIVGQAIKGPRTPINIKSPENAVPLFGKGSPLLKALFEFWDGYNDSPKAQPLQLVVLRAGGKTASLVTPFGVTIETSDAYTGIENDYFVYINNTTSAQKIKVWDINKQKVYDSSTGVNTGHVTVTGALDLAGGTYGKDIDSDPYTVAATLKTVLGVEFATVPANSVVNTTGVTPTVAYDSVTDKTTVSITLSAPEKALVSLGSGWVALKHSVAANITTQFLKYDSATITGPGADLVIAGNIVLDTANGATNELFVSKFALVQGDSELTTDPREKYELFRNALLEIEQFTPDYIIPGGISFDETDTYAKTITKSTSLTGIVSSAASSINVDGASDWKASGNVDLFDGIFTDQLTYSSKAANGEDYTLQLDAPTATITSGGVTGSTVINLSGTNANLLKLRNSGYFKVSSTVYKYTAVTVTDTTAVMTLATPLVATLTGTLTKGVGEVGSNWSGYVVSHAYTELAARELGIGYVKETDIGGSYSFEWKEVPTLGYNLAHFGYMFANFCNEAAVGYNTPICGMNTKIDTLEDGNFSRASIVNWIGSFPTYKTAGGDSTQVTQVLQNGTGLLGDSVAAGSVNYNRSGFTDEGTGSYADPGFGLLLTEEGFIDGTVSTDNYGNVVDLGKFMVVGAGLLTFANGASLNSYIDTCGAYALGMLAGKSQEQGLSYSRIGTTSNVTVTVVVHRKYYNDLARCKYIVVSREKGLGWVINNGDAIARGDSGYKLISTTRIIKYITEGKRTILSNFIGKGLNEFVREAAKTKLADSFKSDVKNGLINGYDFNLEAEDAGAAIGKLYLKISINPPFELTQVTIDTVIDRSVTSV